jgi:hypothetical protein
MSDLPDALQSLPTNKLTGTQLRELQNVSSRGVRVPYDPDTQSPVQEVVRQLGLIDLAPHQLPFGIGPETRDALVAIAKLEEPKSKKAKKQ